MTLSTASTKGVEAVSLFSFALTYAVLYHEVLLLQ